MDETGISSVHKPAKIVATKGARSVAKVTSAERGQTVTVLCAFNAAGGFVPPAFIYPRKRMMESLLNGAPAGSVGLCSPSGWTDGNLFLTWLKHFAEFIKCSKEEPHILLLDGHHSHKTLDAVMYAREHGITMITFPPHCTHKLQPLDLTFFKSLKSNYNAAAGNWMASHPGRRISFFEMAGIFSTAYSTSASVGKAVSGFDAAGIWPYNPDRYGPEDFGGAAVTEEPQPEQPLTSTETGTQGSVNDSDNSMQPSSQSQSSNPVSEPALCDEVVPPEEITGSEDQADVVSTFLHEFTDSSRTQTGPLPLVSVTAANDPVTTSVSSSSSSPAVVDVSNDHVPVDGEPMSSSQVQTVITVSSASAVSHIHLPAPAGTSGFEQLVKTFSPLPKASIQRTRKRKTESAANLTSSPYKNMLLEKQEAVEHQLEKKKQRAEKKAEKKLKPVTSRGSKQKRNHQRGSEPTIAADCQEETINNDQSVEVAGLNSSDRHAAARPSHPGLAEALEILQSLSPRPKILKPRTRKRKMESAAVITSSPYKQALQEKQQMGSKPKDVVLDSKKPKTKTKKSSNKTKDKKKFPTSTLSTDKTPCLYCEEPYCNSEEGFVQCSSCSLWAHYSCAGYDPRVGGSFVCELCQ